MSTIAVSVFAGEVPRTESRLLDAKNATVAVNCDFERGSLRALKGPVLVKEIGGQAATIFKHDVDGWLTWPTRANVVKSAVLDVDGDKPLGHLLITGGRDYPTQYLAGGIVNRLGIPRPSKAPGAIVDVHAAYDTTVVEGFSAGSLELVPAMFGTGVEVQDSDTADVEPFSGVSLYGESGSSTDSEVQRSTSYCYTYVQTLADGIIQQESAPSPPTAVLDVLTGGGVILSGFVEPWEEGLTITHIRIYRTSTGYESSDFRFLAEVPAATLFGGGTYTDTLHDVDLSSEVLQTTTWDPIPSDAKGLIKTDNGIYAAFRGNELLVSEPFIPYAFPEGYRLTVESRIVALAHVDGTIVVLTKGRPYLAQGDVPESLQLVHLPIEQSCLSATSVASLPGGVVYASPDGLMLFSSNEQTLATANVFTREQWQALGPEKLVATVVDGKYVGFFAGTNKGIVFHIGRADITLIELPDDWMVHCLYHHSEDDCAYLSIQTGQGHGIWQYEGGTGLKYRWRSKDFFTSALIGMSAARISGDQKPSNRVQMSIYGPDRSRVRGRVSFSGQEAVRIAPMRSERLWSFELTGTAAVYDARLGGSVEGLEYGQ